MPYTRQPPQVTPGVALHFATGYTLGGLTTGLVVESHEGRPTKVEGNPSHPASLGAASAREQALLPGLYDAHRARVPWHAGQPISRESLLATLATRATRQDGGAGLRFLVEPTGSPLLQALYSRLLERYPAARLVPFAPAGGQGLLEGTRHACGRPLPVWPDFSQARVVLALDEDFLACHPAHLRLAHDFILKWVPPIPISEVKSLQRELEEAEKFRRELGPFAPPAGEGEARP